ncbi:hypothetical protein DGWBC_0062 [Dehalogenimonas sp. WBC-2]|nr:hypothetical protein DGWBC_0062 [Dehalogenimonas sp. WBC-2]
MFIGGLTLGIGGLIISIPFLILLGYLAVLANRSPLNGNVFALIFAIILIGQRSILYFGGGYPDIQSWIIVIFYLGAAIYVLPSSIILIKSGVATGWR